jgi:protein O-mannosyl-transferase
MTGSALRTLVLAVAVLAAVTACYLGTLEANYIWDDWYLFIHNPSLRLEQLAWSDVAAPVLEGTTYFRPVVFMSFWLEFRFFGVEPVQSHAVNLFIHLTNVLLVYLIALRVCQTGLARPEFRAFIGAGIYGLHPMLVESVAWVSGRFDLLATMFTLLAMFADANIRNKALRTVTLALLFAGALGSKEVAVVLPVALLAHRLVIDRVESESLWAAVKRVFSQHRSSIAVLLMVFIGYLIIRYATFQQLFHVNHQLLGISNSLEDRIFLVFGTLVFYIKAILYPFSSVGPLHPLVADEIRGAAGFANVAAGISLIGAIAIGVAKRSAISLFLIAGFAALLPVLQIVPLTIADNIGHDRFLCLPLTFCAISLSLVRLPQTRSISPRIISTLAALLLITWTASGALIVRTAVSQWRDDFTLWSWTYQKYPQTLYAQIQVTSAAIAQHRYDIATYLFDRLRRNGPLDANLQLAYGGMLIAIGDRSEGKKFIEGALVAFPQLHKMTEQQVKSLPFGITRNTEVAFAYRMLAIANLEEGNFADAFANADVALWYRPTYPLFIMTKAFALIGLDREKEARPLIELAMRLGLPNQRERFHADLSGFITETCAVRPEKSPKLCSTRAPKDRH